MVKRLAKFNTELPPCCLRLRGDLIYLGTYKLVEGENRYGSIEIWSENGEKITQYPTNGAILDLKVDPCDESVMVSCHSTGDIMIWHIDSDDPTKLTSDNVKVFETSTLITSINFHQSIEHLLVMTTTTGICCTYDLRTNTRTDMDTQHDLECWYADFGAQPGLDSLVISGGDDRRLIIHDTRTKQAIYNNERIHGAGVVAILPSSSHWCHQSPNTLWTGSYDDHVRSFDLRYMGGAAYPKVNQSENLGGGVWKLIPSPQGDDDKRVLACCMYDGARLLGYDDTGAIEVVDTFKGDHESICYGGDWKQRICTCSFYDEVVQIWDPHQLYT